MKIQKSDKIIFGLFLVAFFPFLLSLIEIGVGYFFSSEKYMLYLFFAGLVAGIIFDIISIRRLLSVLFDIPFRIFAVFYIFCLIFLYGMFMGLPVPELAMGIAGGYYWGRRIRIKGIALREKTISEELQYILGLNFVPRKGQVIAGITIGGSALIIIQYFITRIMIVQNAKTRNG